jgi:hypothetical protein
MASRTVRSHPAGVRWAGEGMGWILGVGGLGAFDGVQAPASMRSQNHTIAAPPATPIATNAAST